MTTSHSANNLVSTVLFFHHSHIKLMPFLTQGNGCRNIFIIKSLSNQEMIFGQDFGFLSDSFLCYCVFVLIYNNQNKD